MHLIYLPCRIGKLAPIRQPPACLIVTGLSVSHMPLAVRPRARWFDSPVPTTANLQENPADCPLISELGFDVFLDAPSVEELQEKLVRKRQAIKTVLLDQVRQSQRK
jgi:hypothetical protein